MNSKQFTILLITVMVTTVFPRIYDKLFSSEADVLESRFLEMVTDVGEIKETLKAMPTEREIKAMLRAVQAELTFIERLDASQDNRIETNRLGIGRLQLVKADKG